MALRDWLGRLTGRGTEVATPEPPPVTAPPGGPPAPAPPTGPPSVLPPAAPDFPSPPTLPSVPPPFVPQRTDTGAYGGLTGPQPGYLPPGSEAVPPRDDAAALRAAEAREAARQEVVPPPAPPPIAASEPAPAPARGGWLARLKAGLSRSSVKLTGSVTTLLRRRRLDEAVLEELEETLIAADLGVAASARIVERFRRTRLGREVTDAEVQEALADEVAQILAPVADEMEVNPRRKPHVVLVVGVNGTGKTTTIAKLGRIYREHGLSCTFVAGDTFRAAAVEQLQIWGERTGCAVAVPAKPGADPAGLAFDALTAAKAAGTDILLVDTAGRLHNKAALMEELRKVVRVMKRVDPTAPHSVLLVLDATTGQNAVQQCRVFKDMVDVTGIAVTKLDGSAKGGVVVALAQEIGLPLHMVGVGETAQDLRPFKAEEFARSLVGLD